MEVRYTEAMTQVAVKLPDDLKSFVDQSVKSGAFQDAGDFMVNLLYNIKAQSESGLSEEQQAKLANLRAEIAIGIAQADAGDYVEFSADEIIAAGRNRRATQVTH
jgi:Arc/MetJ-type ribon-helix-helix transcriptional regulator